MMPRQTRGRAVALTHAVAFTAFPAAAGLGAVLLSGDPSRWWLLLVIGSLGALFSWQFRRHLPESPRWLAATGRGQEAAVVLARIEKAVERSSGRPLASAEVSPEPLPRRAPFAAIWSPPYRGRTILLVVFQMLQTLGYYGFMHWL